MSGARLETELSKQSTKEHVEDADLDASLDASLVVVTAGQQTKHPSHLPPSSRPIWDFTILKVDDQSAHSVLRVTKKNNPSSTHYIKLYLDPNAKNSPEIEKNAAILAQTEPMMAAVNKLIAGKLIPSVHGIHDGQRLYASSSKNLDDFIPNRIAPLTMEDIIVEVLEKEVEEKASEYRKELENVTPILIDIYNRPSAGTYQFFANIINSFLTDSAVSLQPILQRWQEDPKKYDPVTLTNILDSLKTRQKKADDLQKTADSHSEKEKVEKYETELNNLKVAIQQIELLLIYRQVAYSDITLQKLELLAKRRQDAIEIFFKENNIDRTTLKHFKAIDKLYQKRNIDLNALTVNEIQESIDTFSETIKIKVEHLKRYREVNDIKQYQTSADLIDYQNDKKIIQVTAKDFENISQKDVDNYITCRDRAITLAVRDGTREGDLHNNNQGEGGSVDFDDSNAPRVDPFRQLNKIFVQLRKLGIQYGQLTDKNFELAPNHYDNFPDIHVDYYWPTIETPMHETMVNGLNGVYDIAKNYYAKSDVNAFKKLTYCPAAKFHVFKTALKMILLSFDMIRTLSKLDVHEDTEYMDEKTKKANNLLNIMVLDVTDHFNKILKNVLASPTFKYFLAFHGEYALSLINNELQEYKDNLHAKVAKPAESDMDSKSIRRREKQANNPKLYEYYKELEKSIDLKKLNRNYEEKVFQPSNATEYRLR